jgi:hypothetical protein
MGKNETSRKRVERNAADQVLMDGINKRPTTIPTIYVGGAAVPVTTIVAALQARIDTGKSVTSTRASWQAAVGAERDELAKSAVLVSACRQTLLLAFAGQVDTLAEFGLSHHGDESEEGNQGRRHRRRRDPGHRDPVDRLPAHGTDRQRAGRYNRQRAGRYDRHHAGRRHDGALVTAPS